MTMFPKTSLLLLIIAIGIFSNKASADGLVHSTKDNYGSLKIFCGREEVPINEEKIPWVGCIYLSSGHKATGTFSGHNVEIGVNDAGIEEFRVDGITVENSIGSEKTASGTNLPYVHIGGSAGFSFCTEEGGGACPSSVSVHSRNKDKTILFSVTECLPPDYHRCVGNQANWDYEISRANQTSARQTKPVIAQTPMPPGPFSSWPEELRKPALVSLSSRCGMISIMLLGTYQGPKEAAKEMVQALAMACTDHQMPTDWPGHEDVRAASKQHSATAHELDPTLPDPVVLMSRLPPG